MRARTPIRPREERPSEIDMTPMIDVTFQLIVFFLVANDLSRKEIAEVALPEALHATEHDPDPDLAVIVNLLRPDAEADAATPPRMSVRGRRVDLAGLGRELRARADLRREGGPGQPSAARVLVRADRDVPWRHVQWVLQSCAHEEVRIHAIQFATTRPAEPFAAGGR